jgi:two-component system, cell cycle response regulator DivK
MENKYLILLIESDLDNINLVSSHLIKSGYFCISAKEGIRGLLLAQNHQPDLIILDLLILDLAAIQVVENLKQNPDTTKISIIISLPKKQKQECNLLLIAGASYCVEKPYNLPELEQTIKNSLEMPN